MNNINSKNKPRKGRKQRKPQIRIPRLTLKRKIGNLGEKIAIQSLIKRGFNIKGRNYLRKYGELDVICEKSGKYHFVEVKTVSCVTKAIHDANVIHETWRPEENVHMYKLKRLLNVIQAYIAEKGLGSVEWQLDVIVVLLNLKTRKARIKAIENVIF